MEQELRAVFERFSMFGNRSKESPVQMETRACLKLAKDCGLLCKKLTTTDIDIVFAKTKTKGKRKINFDQFVSCTRQWATRLGLPHPEVIVKIVSAAGPQVNSLVPKDGAKPGTPAASWFKTPPASTLGGSGSSPAPLTAAQAKTSTPTPSESSKYPSSFISLDAKQGSSAAATTPADEEEHKEGERSASKPSIFDKLTDPKLYTGAHKHRFDPKTGQGKGLAGRDRCQKGTGTPHTTSSNFRGSTNANSDETVHSISQILRNTPI